MLWEVATDSLFLFFFFFGSLIFGTYFWFKLNKKRKLAEVHITNHDDHLKKK